MDFEKVCESVTKKVAHKFAVNPRDIIGKSSKGSVGHARKIAIQLIFEITGAPDKKIREYFPGRTVEHIYEAKQDALILAQTDPNVGRNVSALRIILREEFGRPASMVAASGNTK